MQMMRHSGHPPGSRSSTRPRFMAGSRALITARICFMRPAAT